MVPVVAVNNKLPEIGGDTFVSPQWKNEPFPRRTPRPPPSTSFRNLNDIQISGDVDSSFREQCFLYPWIKQRQDLFGTTVAVSGQFVAVGAPNRDTIHG